MATGAGPHGPSTYDRIPYESHPFVQTHPDRLATVARLFGMSPAPPEACRVLELGCAGGGNLVPMASELPSGRFLGIDLSERQVEDGRRTIDALGLDNVELRHLSILDVGEDLGVFDYVIAHGVYSWVPNEVQTKILEICNRNLAPNGVAYVSYNTYPGWHLRGMVRDMMLYHSARFSEPEERILQSRAILDFLASSASPEGPYGLLLREELELLRDKRDSYLFHEHLEESNEALYFFQFAERAGAAGLQFLGEAEPAAMAGVTLPENVRSVLARLSPDLFHSEQYLDFLRNRTFRQTLLCHRDVPLVRAIPTSVLRGLHVASSLQPAPPEAGDAGSRFVGPDDISLTTHDPLVTAALDRLAESWPAWIPFELLLDDARTGGSGAEAEAALGSRLLTFYVTAAFLELHSMPPHFVTEPGERPVPAPLARLQAGDGNRVTNRRHEVVVLTEVERQTLLLLDGVRNVGEVSAALADLVEAGDLTAEESGRPVTDPAEIRDGVARSVGGILRNLARHALLIG